jgi:hypothetical protein
MKKGVLLVFLVVFIVGCGIVPQGETPQDTASILRAVQTGTQGVQIDILQNFPPPVVYDQNELIALVEVKNKGNYNLEAQDCFIQVTGFDPNIIRGDFERPRSCAENVQVLEGKNEYNLEGGFNQIEFRATDIALPDRVFEYNPNLNFLSCYNYQTTASPQVCLDPLTYQIAADQKACNFRKSISVGGGQGGPVGVSHIGVTMVGSKRAVFEINVRNMGSGSVISPDASIVDCSSGLEYTDLDRVAYNVELSGGSLINCNPTDGFVRLVNGQGKIVCNFNVHGNTAFETPLLVDLNYGYKDSISKQVKIVRTPQ